jgi:hypothetical protein
MLQQRVIRKAVNLGVVGLFGLGLLAVDAPPSVAGNYGGHCQVMKDLSHLKVASADRRRSQWARHRHGARGKWEAATVENVLKTGDRLKRVGPTPTPLDMRAGHWAATRVAEPCFYAFSITITCS